MLRARRGPCSVGRGLAVLMDSCTGQHLARPPCRTLCWTGPDMHPENDSFCESLVKRHYAGQRSRCTSLAPILPGIPKRENVISIFDHDTL